MSLTLVVDNDRHTEVPDSLEQACAAFYATQLRIRELSAEKDDLRSSSAFAATILHNAVTAVGQQQKKFGPYTVHLGIGYDVFCKGCGTFATSCGCPGGPLEVHTIAKPRIWLKKGPK